MTLRLIVLVALTLLGSVLGRASSEPAPPPMGNTRLVLITLDGVRIQEMFGGLDADVLASTLRSGQTLADHPAYRRFWAATPEARREKLMPFLWGTLMKAHGSIAGNPAVGSRVRLGNAHRFSYPGYAEILLGEAHDDRIRSNDPVHNPEVTLLEYLKVELRVPANKVATFASWHVLDYIAEHVAGTTLVNAGLEPFDHGDARTRRLSALQFETPTPWDGVRHDAYTFRLGMAHLESARPRVLYLAFDETDDWAHDGRYDRVLDALARTDRYLAELWTWLQAQRDYSGTHVLLTTDHGRGRTPKDWRDHGAKVEGAEDVWIAFASQLMDRRGEWRDHEALSTRQVAATLAGWMGIDWQAVRPKAGAPIR